VSSVALIAFASVPPRLFRPFPLASTAPAAHHPAPGLSVPRGAGLRPSAASSAGAAGGAPGGWGARAGGGGGARGGARVKRGLVFPIRQAACNAKKLSKVV